MYLYSGGFKDQAPKSVDGGILGFLWVFFCRVRGLGLSPNLMGSDLDKVPIRGRYEEPTAGGGQRKEEDKRICFSEKQTNGAEHTCNHSI